VITAILETITESADCAEQLMMQDSDGRAPVHMATLASPEVNIPNKGRQLAVIQSNILSG